MLGALLQSAFRPHVLLSLMSQKQPVAAAFIPVIYRTSWLVMGICQSNSIQHQPSNTPSSPQIISPASAAAVSPQTDCIVEADKVKLRNMTCVLTSRRACARVVPLWPELTCSTCPAHADSTPLTRSLRLLQERIRVQKSIHDAARDGEVALVQDRLSVSPACMNDSDE